MLAGNIKSGHETSDNEMSTYILKIFEAQTLSFDSANSVYNECPCSSHQATRSRCSKRLFELGKEVMSVKWWGCILMGSACFVLAFMLW